MQSTFWQNQVHDRRSCPAVHGDRDGRRPRRCAEHHAILDGRDRTVGAIPRDSAAGGRQRIPTPVAYLLCPYATLFRSVDRHVERALARAAPVEVDDAAAVEL